MMFNKQSSSNGPVPEDILYQLLNEAEQAVRIQLEEEEFVGELDGLALGYYASTQGSDELGEYYEVAWGDLPQNDLDYPEIDSKEQPESDSAENPLSFDFVDDLAAQLENAMREKTPHDRLEGRDLIVRVYGMVGQSRYCWGIAGCCQRSERWRRQYYYYWGSCQIWCSNRPCSG